MRLVGQGNGITNYISHSIPSNSFHPHPLFFFSFHSLAPFIINPTNHHHHPPPTVAANTRRRQPPPWVAATGHAAFTFRNRPQPTTTIANLGHCPLLPPSPPPPTTTTPHHRYPTSSSLPSSPSATDLRGHRPPPPLPIRGTSTDANTNHLLPSSPSATDHRHC
ncbi:rho GTPase-activating protein gacO-like [Helianthus annuus]|uniref:rho GTPase-activating protein gacO-like n=1 Tax=Helianthus annuus TaxID=4232 RepID=UPI000B8F2475|nr:rho GTPase-activating protein gacO-like [Helianthus annuus]